MTWSLAIICFLIWLVSKAAGRGALERLGLPGESEALLEVLEKKRLSPGRSVMLMRVGPKVLALGLTESGFQTLTELDGEDLQAYREKRREARVAAVTPPSEPVASPSEVVKHYVSIIPGLGVKK